MLFISHRGNTNGKESRENSPELIEDVLNRGFYVETDLWNKSGKFYLGHDEPLYNITIDFFNKTNIIYHAKNLAALEFCLDSNIHTFWHQEDDYTITSYGYIWVYPGIPVSNKSKCIIVDNNKPSFKYDCIGVCSDYVQLYKTYNI